MDCNVEKRLNIQLLINCCSASLLPYRTKHYVISDFGPISIGFQCFTYSLHLISPLQIYLIFTYHSHGPHAHYQTKAIAQNRALQTTMSAHSPKISLAMAMVATTWTVFRSCCSMLHRPAVGAKPGRRPRRRKVLYVTSRRRRLQTRQRNRRQRIKIDSTRVAARRAIDMDISRYSLMFGKISLSGMARGSTQLSTQITQIMNFLFIFVIIGL